MTPVVPRVGTWIEIRVYSAHTYDHEWSSPAWGRGLKSEQYQSR